MGWTGAVRGPLVLAGRLAGALVPAAVLADSEPAAVQGAGSITTREQLPHRLPLVIQQIPWRSGSVPDTWTSATCCS